MTDSTKKSLLFISMLGENQHFNPDEFVSLCSSGQEKDWILDWFSLMANKMGFSLLSVIFVAEIHFLKLMISIVSF